MSLESYHKKRNFNLTTEPKGKIHSTPHSLFVIQKHAASHLHYDFRLEMQGVLKSWAVPKGPCLDPDVKRLAIHVEDHPIEYGHFEGIIPKGEYGAGIVMLWDDGQWISLDPDPVEAYHQGHLRFELKGKKLEGRWDLIRLKKEKEWMWIKYKDHHACSLKHYDIELDKPLSISTDRSMEEIGEDYPIKNSKKKSNYLSSQYNKTRLVPHTSKSSFPTKINVQLATLVDKPPKGDQWLHEVKFDGYRIIAFKKGSTVSLYSRTHKDWTAKFNRIAQEIRKIPIKNGIFDGEIVLLDEENRSDFQRLQNAMKMSEQASFIYYLFDLLYLESYDLRQLTLVDRKHLLEPLLENTSPILRYSDHIIDSGKEVFERSCAFALEGIISKHVDSVYLGKRTKDWLKIKCTHRQEFIIGGFSYPSGARKYFGSLYLGVFNPKGELIFTGNVGTGFTEQSLKILYQKLKKIIIEDNPFSSSPPRVKAATWVEPQLVIEVEFTEWTKEGRLRHPSFKGLRMDKEPSEIIKEEEYTVEKIETKSSDLLPTLKKRLNRKSSASNPRLTHPEKILYEEDKITKQDVYNYYNYIGTTMLPFIRNRPLTLVRCPQHYKECFFQKHINSLKNKEVHSIPIKEKEEIRQYVYLNDKAGLLSLAQIGVLEVHAWGSTIEHVEHPDIIIFDLDPDPDLHWAEVVSAAFEIKEELEQLKLTTFVKTTGGKGLHLVLPIQPSYEWDLMKHFTHTFVTYLEKRYPNRYVSTMSKYKRKGKIFVDYLRNQHGASAISPYSLRARLHAPIATPIAWAELTHNMKDTYYTIKTLGNRLENLKEDPWKDFWSIKQSLCLDKL